MKITLRTLMGIVFALAVAIAIVSYWVHRDDVAKYKELTSLLDSTINDYETILIDKDHKINVQTQVVAGLENAVAAGLVEIEELKSRGLKKDVSIIRLQAEVERLSLIAQFVQHDTTTVYIPVSEEGFLKVPTDFKFSDKWTDIEGTVHLTNVTINSMVSRTEPTFYLGYKSQGFLKKALPVVIVEDANPFTTVTGLQNVIIQDKPPVLQRPNSYRIQGAVGTVVVIQILKSILK